MKEYLKKNTVEYIFIGTSKTQNHISSSLLKQKGLNTYTYGVPGVLLSDYSYMVYKTIQLHPKGIILNINLLDLYVGNILPHIVQPTFIDFFMQFKSLNTIARPDNLFDIFPLKNYVEGYQLLFNKTPENIKEKVTTLSKIYHYSPDCDIFTYRGKKRILTLCTNGNGTIWYNNPITITQQPFHFLKPNPKLLSFINHLIAIIKQNNIEVYLLLDDIRYNSTVSYDNSTLYNDLKIDKNHILDLTDIIFKEDEWADSIHINGHGKRKFTLEIIKKLSEKEKK